MPPQDSAGDRWLDADGRTCAPPSGGSCRLIPQAEGCLRWENGNHSLHDGPFAETREQLGGFYMIEAADLDAAIAIARQIPLSADGTVEVRPVMSPPGM